MPSKEISTKECSRADLESSLLIMGFGYGIYRLAISVRMHCNCLYTQCNKLQLQQCDLKESSNLYRTRSDVLYYLSKCIETLPAFLIYILSVQESFQVTSQEQRQLCNVLRCLSRKVVVFKSKHLFYRIPFFELYKLLLNI